MINMEISLPVALLGIILSIISGIIAGRCTLRSKEKEYLNIYHKMLLQKRLKAYDMLEKFDVQLLFFESQDNKKYQSCFQNEKSLMSVKNNLNKLVDYMFWFSEDASHELIKIQTYFDQALEYNKKNEGIRNFGTQHFIEVDGLCRKMATTIATDMLNMYKIEDFLKYKKSILEEDNHNKYPSAS